MADGSSAPKEGVHTRSRPDNKRSKSPGDEQRALEEKKKGRKPICDRKNFVERAVIWIKAGSYNPVWEKVKTESPDSRVVAGRELNRLVGGYLEVVPMEHVFGEKLPLEEIDGRHLIAYCNEEGRLKDLPLNVFTQEFGLRGQDGLVGDVVVALCNDEGETLVFTEADLALIPRSLLP